MSLFDDTFFSFDEKLLKPDPNFIKVVCNKLTVEPASILYVDDSPVCTNAARVYGINAITYTDFDSFTNESSQYFS